MTAIWAVKSLGIDPATDYEIFLNKDGKRTSSWSAADMVICGDELPDFSGNFRVQLDMERVELELCVPLSVRWADV